MSDFAKGGSDLTAASSNLVSKDAPVTNQSRDYDQHGAERAVLTDDGWKTEIATKDRTDTGKSTPLHTDVVTDIRSQNGSQPQTVMEATPESVVTIEGLGSMTLRSALTAGFVVRAPDGTLARGPDHPGFRGDSKRPSVEDGSVHEDDAEGANEGEEIHPELRVDEMDQPSEEAFTALIEATQPGMQLRATEEFAKTGEITAETISTLSTQAGVEPAVMLEKIAVVQDAFESQAKDAIGQFAGAEFVDKIVEYGWKETPELMEAAVRQHLSKRQVNGYEAVAMHYWNNADIHSPQAILDHDWGEFTARQDSEGRIIMYEEGHSLSWKSYIEPVLRTDRKAMRK